MPVQSKAIWIAGPSGTGKSTVAKVLSAHDLDQWGYHTDILHPGKNWEISIPILQERVYWANTKSGHSPFFIGVMANWRQVAAVGWRRIAVLIAEPMILTDRLRKRVAEGKESRDPKAELEKADPANTQFEVNYWTKVAFELDAEILDASGSPKDIARLIRKL
jgi:hypothetical protein